jgi:hypothetical protein
MKPSGSAKFVTIGGMTIRFRVVMEPIFPGLERCFRKAILLSLVI